MTLCKFFAKGNCRYGDRCRFEHPDPYSSYQEPRDRSNYNQYSRPRQEEYDRSSYQYEHPPKRNDYYPSNRPQQQHFNQYDTYDKYSNNRYDVLDDYDDYEPSEDYSEDEWYTPTQPIKYNNRYQKNKHEWVSEDFRKKSQVEQKAKASFHHSSTPKSQTSFSFKDSNVSTSKYPSDLHMNENNLVIAEVIKEDALAWEFGNLWPFSCYSPIQNQASFPWFDDVSPEELRFEAYKSTENNTYESYVQSVKLALQDVQNKRAILKEPSVKLMSIIEKIRAGEDLSSEMHSAGLSLLSSKQSPLPGVNAAYPATDTKQAAAAFSFKLSETDSAPKTSAMSFSFKSGGEPSSQVTSDEVYTPLKKLSEEDKEQFNASTFTLGKIPTVPPPKVMCF